MKFLTVILFMALGLSLLANQQENEFNSLYNDALNYKKASQYAECIKKLHLSIEYADENGLKSDVVKASIALAEVYRKTREFEKGLEILKNLEPNPENKLYQVRIYGRLAAIYQEGIFGDHISNYDSIVKYLDLGLKLAIEYQFDNEKASLDNEYGYLISGRGDRINGQVYLLKAAKFYQLKRDTANYVNVLTHVLGNYIMLNEENKADSVKNLISRLLKNQKLYAEKAAFYHVLSQGSLLKNDSVGYYKWESQSTWNMEAFGKEIHNNQIAAYEVLHQTEEFKNKANIAELEAAQKSLELEQQTTQKKALLFFILFLIVMAAGVIGLFFIERKQRFRLINNQLNIANEKYQMLIVESNHRIKNNLQMVISMLEYASNDLSDPDSNAFKRMSAKIYAISALHRHLYLEEHNEKVDVGTYFYEIIEHYNSISNSKNNFICDFHPIGIESERLVYFGLIINELISNTIEHGKPNSKIEIEVKKHLKYCSLIYSDNSEIKQNAKEGLGSVLIRQLISRVEGFDFEIDYKTGRYSFKFNE